MDEISMIGLDIAKNVFHIHGVNASGAPVLRRQLRRGQVEGFFAKLPPTLVGLEACGSAHHWARGISRRRHQVRLMPPGYVTPYVERNKKDGRDAEAICEAVGRPSMRFVAVKSVEQQATLAVHTTRRLLVQQRTAAGNALRGMPGELGIAAAQGVKGLRTLMQQLEQPSEAIPEIMRGALLLLARQWNELDVAERALEKQITRTANADREAQRLMAVPTVGPMIASTVVPIIGPTVGTAISLCASRSALAVRVICFSSARSATSSSFHCRASSNRAPRMISGIASLGCSSCCISVRRPFTPCAATIPNSLSMPRSALPAAVRCCTRSRRVVCTASVACCSTLFTATKRIEGRPTASQIASASRPSFLLRST